MTCRSECRLFERLIAHIVSRYSLQVALSANLWTFDPALRLIINIRLCINAKRSVRAFVITCICSLRRPREVGSLVLLQVVSYRIIWIRGGIFVRLEPS